MSWVNDLFTISLRKVVVVSNSSANRMPFIKKSNKTNTCTKDKKVLLKTMIFIFIAFRTVTDFFIVNNIVF